MHHFFADQCFHPMQRPFQVAVLQPKVMLLLSLVIADLIEERNFLLQSFHLATATNQQLDSLFQLLHLPIMLLPTPRIPILLQLILEILHIGTLLHESLAAGEELPPGVEDLDSLKDLAGFVGESVRVVVGVGGEGALEQHVVEEGQQDNQLVGEEVQVHADVLPVGLRGDAVQVDLPQNSEHKLEVVGFYLHAGEVGLDAAAQQSLLLFELGVGIFQPEVLTLHLPQQFLHHPLVAGGMSLNRRRLQPLLKESVHLDLAAGVVELPIGLRLYPGFDPIGTKREQIEWFYAQVDIGIVASLVVEFLFDFAQNLDNFIEFYPHVGVLLQTASHQVQQLGTVPRPLLDADEVAEDAAAVETFEGLREHHAVDVHPEEVDVRLRLQIVELLAAEGLQLLLRLRHQQHDLEGGGVLHVDPVFDVAAVGVALDEGGVEICEFDLAVVGEDVLGAEVAVDDAPLPQVEESFRQLAAVLHHFFLSEGLFFLVHNSVDLLLEGAFVHLLKQEAHVADAFGPAVAQLQELVEELHVFLAAGVLVQHAQQLHRPVRPLQPPQTVKFGHHLVQVLAFRVVEDRPASGVLFVGPAIGQPLQEAGPHPPEVAALLEFLAEIEGGLGVRVVEKFVVDGQAGRGDGISAGVGLGSDDEVVEERQSFGLRLGAGGRLRGEFGDEGVRQMHGRERICGKV